MEEQKRYNLYTAADIKKYLSGQMSNAEMHAIEKAALDDPFLAEAIEGYERMEQKDWGKELAALKNKLVPEENKSLTSVYSFRKWWRAAAAIIILVSGIAVTYFFNDNKSKEVAATVKAVSNDSSALVKEDSNIAINNIAANKIAKDSELKFSATTDKTGTSTRETTLLSQLDQEKESDSNFIYKPAPEAADDHKKDIAATEAASQDSHAKATDAFTVDQGYLNNAQPAEVNKMKSLSVQNQSTNASNNFINAQVVTADNKPVAFANISVQKNNPPVYTDAKGNFKLPATDSTVSGIVTSAGYIPKKFSLKNSISENKIVLQQDTVNETVITSARSKSVAKPLLQKNVENADTTDEDAAPSVGWYEYNNYLNENLIFPNEAKEKNIHGVVEVFVKLNSNGEISQVKVNKPLCPECDAEAIRLVKEGPKWDIKKTKSKKAKVKIRF